MAYGDFWTQTRTPFTSYLPFTGATQLPGLAPQVLPPVGGNDGAALQGGLPDEQLNQLVQLYLQGQLGQNGALTNLDPTVRAKLEKEIKGRFQQLAQGGLPLEARPGSKSADALANGELGNLSPEDLLQLLVALLQYAQQRRDAASVASQQSAPLAPTGSWGKSGNSYGGGTSTSGANSSAPSVSGPAPAAGPIPNGSPSGVKLAESARDVAQSMNSTGWCYRGVSTAVARATGVQLTGASAYMAADQLASNPKFKEISVSPDQLAKLPPGAIVVWGQTAESPHGHISVALGNGQEASDHIQTQMTSLRGHQNYRVFVLADGGNSN